MKLGTFVTTATEQLSTVEQLLPSFMQKINERFNYYSPLFNPKSIEIAAHNGTLTSVVYTLQPKPEAASDHFLSKDPVAVSIKNDMVEGALKTMIKEAVEKKSGGIAEIGAMKWQSKTLTYRDGKIEDMDILTAECTITFPEKKENGAPSANGKKSSDEEEPVLSEAQHN